MIAGLQGIVDKVGDINAWVAVPRLVEVAKDEHAALIFFGEANISVLENSKGEREAIIIPEFIARVAVEKTVKQGHSVNFTSPEGAAILSKDGDGIKVDLVN